jgi:hypothetical protein
VSRAFENALEGVGTRLGVGQDLRQQFEAARAKIRQENPLPRVNGNADIYPARQDIVLASNLRWSPRPIIQSYSAFEPELADINAKHLLADSTPQHVFFDVSPIDSRLAALEDGVSWPLLLTRYRLVGCTGQFLILDRNPDVTNRLEIKDISTSTQGLGKEFALPKTGEPVWAEISVRPAFLGRILAALFKPPQLHILFRYEDGHTETFRYVSAMGRSGFIISPVIHDAREFAALSARGRDQYFSGTRPTSVEIKGDPGDRLFWQRAFKVRLRRIEVPAQPQVDKLVFDQWISDPGLNHNLAGSAECAIDAINGKPVTAQGIDAKGRLLVQGWAAVCAEKGISADDVFLRLVGNDGNWLRATRARTVPRPDVNAYFKHPEMGAVGFEAVLDTAELKGNYNLQIYVERQNQFFSCPITVEIRNN